MEFFFLILDSFWRWPEGVWREAVVRELGRTSRDCINELSALWPAVGFSQWKKAPAGYVRVGERGGAFIPPAPFLQRLWVWQHLSPKMNTLPGSLLHIALNSGTVPSPTSSVLREEMASDGANSLLVSLNPANTLISNPFNKLSSNYPIWMCFLPGPWLTHLGMLPNASVIQCLRLQNQSRECLPLQYCCECLAHRKLSIPVNCKYIVTPIII